MFSSSHFDDFIYGQVYLLTTSIGFITGQGILYYNCSFTVSCVVKLIFLSNCLMHFSSSLLTQIYELQHLYWNGCKRMSISLLSLLVGLDGLVTIGLNVRS